MTFDIKPVVFDAKDASKTALWSLETRVWSRDDKKFVKVGTKDAKVTVEDGFLIVANKEGERASLKLPKSISPNGPVVAVHPEFLKVTLRRLAASGA